MCNDLTSTSFRLFNYTSRGIGLASPAKPTSSQGPCGNASLFTGDIRDVACVHVKITCCQGILPWQLKHNDRKYSQFMQIILRSRLFTHGLTNILKVSTFRDVCFCVNNNSQLSL